MDQPYVYISPLCPARPFSSTPPWGLGPSAVLGLSSAPSNWPWRTTASPRRWPQPWRTAPRTAMPWSWGHTLGERIITRQLGFPGWLSSKESACSAGDPGSTPEWGRSPGGGNSNPLQSSCWTEEPPSFRFAAGRPSVSSGRAARLALLGNEKPEQPGHRKCPQGTSTFQALLGA